jgi:pSer/pThr/pTyr-binding forkhead associated (FHA) protein
MAAPAPAPARPRTEESEPTLAPMVGGMVSCPNCGAQNPAAFKFCGACGARLEGAASPPQAAPPSVADAGAANLVLIRPDGSEGGAFALGEGITTVGRSTGQIFAADAYLSPDHATFDLRGGRMTLRDEGSLNGVYVRVPGEKPIEIASGDVVRMGQELVRVENLEDAQPADDGTEIMGSIAGTPWGRVSLIVGDGQIANTFLLAGDGVVLGRERGDILFPEDGYVSGTHVRVQRQGDRLVITDLNSSNGTFLRVSFEQELSSGDYILAAALPYRLLTLGPPSRRLARITCAMLRQCQRRTVLGPPSLSPRRSGSPAPRSPRRRASPGRTAPTTPWPPSRRCCRTCARATSTTSTRRA